MGSFLLKLLSSTGHRHHYLAVIEDGTRRAHLLLDTHRRAVIRATAEGEPSGDQWFALDPEAPQHRRTGGAAPPEVPNASPLSDAEFSRLAVHLGIPWLRDGQPPASVVKHFY